MTSAARVEALLEELGLTDRTTRVAENVWTLKKGSAPNAPIVQIIAAPDLVVAPAKIADRTPDGDREAFYRTLLETNVGLLGAFFTLEANGSIRLNQVLPVDWLQDKELAFIVGNVAARAEDLLPLVTERK